MFQSINLPADHNRLLFYEMVKSKLRGTGNSVRSRRKTSE